MTLIVGNDGIADPLMIEDLGAISSFYHIFVLLNYIIYLSKNTVRGNKKG